MNYFRQKSLRYSLILLLCFGVSIITQAQSKKPMRFYKMKVVVYKKDTLAKILRRFVREDSIISKNNPMIQKTLKSNPQIKDWRNLKPGETLYVYINPKYIDMDKLKAFRKEVKQVSKKIAKKVKKKKKSKEIKKWSAFYMASMGTFSQENSDIAKVNFKQNSPLTLGLMYTHYPENKNFTIASSIYFSYLLAASSNLGKENIEVPLEIGFNSYYQHPIMQGRFNLYGGFDFEKFNTFSLEGVENENDILFDENQIGYLTIGYSQAFNLMKHGFLFKASISQSVFSSRTAGFSGDDNSQAYSGNKVMLFLLSKITDKYYVSSLFKYHTLTGPSNVSVMRIGIGAGYLF